MSGQGAIETKPAQMFGFWKVVPADSPSNQTDNAGTSAAPKDDASTSGDHTVEPVASPTPNDGTGPIHEPPKAEEVNNDIAFPRAASPVNNPDTSDDTAANPSALAPEVPRRARRISFRSFGFFYGREKVAPILPKDEEETIEPEIVTTAPESQKKVPKREIRKVEKAALVLRSFLLGPGGIQPSSSSAKSSKGKKTAALKQPNQNKLNKVNGQMLTPDKANKVIAKLRTLPVPDGPEIPGVEFAGERIVSHAEGPIHAVCLDCTEEEAEKYHFSHLAGSSDKKFKTEAVTGDPPSIASANLATLIPVLREMRIITLVTSPDLGFSQPLGGEGLLAGAIPSAENTGTGMLEITSQILALGFATSNAIYPNHSGIYPPTDRMSVLSCKFPAFNTNINILIFVDWWGFEVCLPPPTISYLEVSHSFIFAISETHSCLQKVKSIQNAALNLLTAFSLFNNGVREILPFV